ncbi:MAG TPA: ABC transporter ATP-binding protein [Nakamurella sp.]|jgi:oligopeptide/dipeptide ABC transporter ATP-binding protein|nr:ABC transporter ATP-binding protein [Nakamurella sp.]
MTPLVEVQGLRVRLPGPGGPVTIVDGLDFAVEEGETFGIAGESGSGKTMTALALLRLLPPRAIVEGRIRYQGKDLLGLDRKGMQAVRGRQISMVFQDPMTSLHPMLTIGKILTTQVRHHFGVSRAEARRRAVEMLAEVRIPDPEGSLSSFPHQFSGGMRQRIAIAGALICRPKLLIADEPTTALDVTVQAGVIGLLERLQRESGLSVVLITHDLGVMSAAADRLTVMYAGRIVESGTTRRVLQQPRHPYTQGLLAALPQPDRSEDELVPIPGSPPVPTALPSGCAFHPRCPMATDACRLEVPELVAVPGGRLACPPSLAGLQAPAGEAAR